MPPVAKKAAAAAAPSQTAFQFDRAGGALVRADVFVYRDPESQAPTLVDSIQFKDFRLATETATFSLPAGTYAAVTFITIREGINSDFRYALRAAGQAVAQLEGDAKKLPASDGQPDPLKHVRFFKV
jgi:hypothetical protein